MNLKFKIILLLTFIIQVCNGQWTQMSDLPDSSFTFGTSFTIGNKGYALNTNCYNELWEYNPQNDSWTKKANFPGICRFMTAGFSINGKGYVGLGRNINNQQETDFWEYDPTTDTWTQKAPFPGTGRDRAVGFSIGNKGYLGTGYTPTTQTSGILHNDFWEYNPLTDSWTQKANVPGPARENAAAISLNGKGYLGLGGSIFPNVDLADFYEYDPALDTWTQKQNMPGSEARNYAGVFALNNTIYVTGGIKLSTPNPQILSSCLRFNPVTNSWSYQQDFAGIAAFNQVAVTFSNSVYVGAGLNINRAKLSEWWKYEINTTGTAKTEPENLSFECYPSPVNNYLHLKISNLNQGAKFKLFSANGILVLEREIDASNTLLDVTLLRPGMYIAEMTNRKSTTRKKIIKE